MFKKLAKDTFPYDSSLKVEGASSLLQSHISSYNPAQEIKETLSAELSEESEIYIAENAKIEGSISFDHMARIDGHFSGEVLSKGKIIIGSKAVVRADLFLEEAIISGTVEGNITTTKRLILIAPAKVSGDITAPSVSVAEGVSIRGQLHVMKSNDTEENDPLSFDESSFT